MAGTNRLLSLLPKDEYRRLQPQLEGVLLPKGKVLYDMGDVMHHAYFPLSGMVSLLAMTHEGQTVEVAMIGNEGVIGLPIVLHANTAPYRVLVQIPGSACRIRSEEFRHEFQRDAALQEVLLRYTHSLIGQISQSAVCHRFHTVTQRLCRWLLIARDRVDTDDIELTQELIAHMLGIPRTGVSMAATELQDKALIRSRHGKIHIMNRKGLEAAACECYHIVRDAIGQFPPAAAH
jgi:CRP-like cAMP-binding protein